MLVMKHKYPVSSLYKR